MTEPYAPITGRCTDIDEAPAVGLIVRAFMRQPDRSDRQIGDTRTGEDGRYRIIIGPDHLVELRNPSCFVFIRVSQGDKVIGESDLTPSSVGDLVIDLALEVRPGSSSPGATPRRVHGIVRDECNRVLSGATVRALDRDLRTETLLGAAPTVDGRYEIRYFPTRLRRRGKRHADLVVLVVDHDGHEIYRSPVQFGVDDDLELDVSLCADGYHGPSEWELRDRRMHDLLEDVPPEELRDSEEFGEVAFLVAQADWSRADVANLICSHRLAARIAYLAAPVAPPLFYAFLAQGQPATFQGTFAEDFRRPDRLQQLDDRLLERVVALGGRRQRELIAAAVRENLVPATTLENAEVAIAILDGLRRDFASRASAGSGRGTLSEMIALVPDAAQAEGEIVDGILEHSSDLEALWNRLVDRKVVTDVVAAELQHTFEIGALTGNYPPLVAELTARRRRGDVLAVRQFASLSRADWVTLLTESRDGRPPIGVPGHVDGDTEEERAEQYAARLDWRFERRFPTASFAAKLGRAVVDRGDLPRASAAVASFLDDNPGFELDRHLIDHYLLDHPISRQRISDDPQLRQDLMAVQRVFRLQPTFSATETLLRHGFESAQQVYEAGEVEFTEAISDEPITGLDVARIYRRAELTYAAALTLFGEFNAGFNGAAPAAVADWTIDEEQARRIAELPNLHTLFGSQDFCECAHCQSVYSPAAHFVDMLKFLDNRRTNGMSVHAGKTLKQVLFDRRPDLGDVELSCANTETSLPYLDLVNEILENAVVPFGDSFNIAPDRVAVLLAPGVVGDELRTAMSEQTGFVVEKDATIEVSPRRGQWIVRDSVRALTLTDFGIDTGAGVPMEEIGVDPRYQTIGSAEDLAAAPAYVNPLAYRDLMRAIYPLDQPFSFWDQVARAHLAHLGVPLSALLELFESIDAPISATTRAECRIGILHRALFQPADPESEDPWRYWGLAETSNREPHPDAPNDPSRKIVGTWIEVLGSVSVFLHRSGLSYPELRQLVDMRFVDPAGVVAIPDDPNCDTSNQRLLGFDGAALNRANGFIRVWRALGCRMWELDEYLVNTSTTVDHLPPERLTLIAECSRVREVTGLDWQTVRAVYMGLDTPRYVDRARADQPILSVYERVFRQDASLAAVFPRSVVDLDTPMHACAAALMSALQLSEADLLQALAALEISPSTSLRANELHQLFALVSIAKASRISIEDMGRAIRLMSERPWADPALTISWFETLDQLEGLGITLAEVHSLLTAGGPVNPAADRDVAEFIKGLRVGYVKVVEGPGGGAASARGSGASDDASSRSRIQRRLYITEALSTMLGLDGGTTSVLLAAPTDTTSLGAVFEQFLDPLTDSANRRDSETVSAADIEAAGIALTRLRNAAMLIDRLDLRTSEVAWWLETGAGDTAKWPPLLGFPATASDAAVPFDRWRNLQRFLAWRSTLAPSEFTAFDLVAAVSAAIDTGGTSDGPSVLDLLVHLTGWSRNDVGALAVAFDFGDTAQAPMRFATSLSNPGNLLKLSRSMAALARLGVAGERAIGWVRDTGPNGATERVAVDVTRVAHAKYSPEQWRQISKPIQDNLREAKRRALVSWLVAHPNPGVGQLWHHVDGLYDYFLLDVQMSACMMTSRLVQAVASVQLFVQRCLLGLEADVRIDPAKDVRWHQWQWMKNYRVWEANRKVFLYPENWLEPELRDEKSSFFRDLEHDLMQDDVNSETAERAYATYLHKLESVANLEIRTMATEHTASGSTHQHVIGRNRSRESADYYYRRRVSAGRWTPWEPVDLDITTDHVLAAFQNERLTLFWPQFVERSTLPAAIAAPAPGESVSTDSGAKLQMRLFYSERRNGRWSPTVLAGAMREGDDPELQNFRLSVRPTDASIIEVARTDDPALHASWTTGGFQRIGQEVNFVGFGDDDQFDAVPPLGAQFVNNLIRQHSVMNFWIGRSAHPGFQDRFLGVTAGVEKVRVLNQLPPGPAYIVLGSDQADLGNEGDFFFWDRFRTYHGSYEVTAVTTSNESGRPVPTGVRRWKFWFVPHYHPFVGLFIERLATQGMAGLLNRRLQMQPVDGTDPRHKLLDFEEAYHPARFDDGSMDASGIQVQVVGAPLEEGGPESYPIEEVDFEYQGSYSCYNWELFFHVPLLIASKLAANRQFEEAMRWFHYVFDPIGGDALPVQPDDPEPTPQQRFWITKPFYLRSTASYQAERISAILAAAAGATSLDDSRLAPIREWRDNPFNPHLVARMRTVAYQKNVVMKYIQTLIDWGDSLFAHDTRESMNEATQLYVLASALLGRRPRQVPVAKPRPDRTYNELVALGLRAADPLIDVENLLPATPPTGSAPPTAPALPALNLMYFRVPNNEKLLGVWDLVDDRLFKVRNCMDLAGMVRQLPLFAPPIDPGLLVKATAAGLSVADALAGVGAPMPVHRFGGNLQLARAAVDETVALGSGMAAALEKRDGEALAQIRLTLEHTVRQHVLAVRADQIDEAVRSMDTLTEQRKVIQARFDHYDALIRNGWNVREKSGLDLTETALTETNNATISTKIAGGLAMVPQFNVGATGAMGTPTTITEYGGAQLAGGAQAASAYFQGLNQRAQLKQGRASTIAGYMRREEDWQLQKKLAEAELVEMDKQIIAAQIRHQIAVKEHANQKLQIDAAKAEAEYLRSKYTNQELYDWMIGQTSFVYFQSYQLALDLAKRAEQSFRFELGVLDSGFVQNGQWNSLRRGLLAGEQLALDLRRMEAAYYAQNTRDYELTKHVSLAQLDPMALLLLQRNGECVFSVPEFVFDLDHPGHYFRRIKSVSMSIPCVVGPYTTVGATLTLTDGKVRVVSTVNGDGGDPYAERTPDDRFRRSQKGVVQRIATSAAQQDGGVFELDFSDPRYLPFEGAGAISEWSLTLAHRPAMFDLTTITDVVIHMKYTAREGGEPLAGAASAHAERILAGEQTGGTPMIRVLDIRREFPDEWHRFTHPETAVPILLLADIERRLPFFTRNRETTVHRVEIAAAATSPDPMEFVVAGLGADISLPMTRSPYNGLVHGISAEMSQRLQNVSIRLQSNRTDVLDELLLLIGYTAR